MGPVQAAVEMNNTPDQVVATLTSMEEYVDAFNTAFPDEAEPVSFANFATAIAEFEETLVTPGAAFDRWMTGDDAAMSEDQKRGLALFMDSGCAGCHSSAVYTAPLAVLNPAALLPPVTSTVPSGSTVALSWRRALAMVPAGCQAGVGRFKSIFSAVARGGSFPPTINTFPGSYMTAVP